MPVSDIRYKRLGYIALSVTDPVRSEKFYREIVGVVTTLSEDGDSVFLRVSDRHHDILLVRSDRPALRRISWEMETSAALSAVQEHLEGLGVKTIAVDKAEAKSLGIGKAFRATEPTTGATFEFYYGIKAEPAFVPTHTKIVRLGHVVLGSPNKAETERFLIDELNFRASDKIGDVVTFMRCFPNPLHHSFGIGGSPVTTFNHVNFMVSDIDDIGRANNRMQKNDIPIAFGPGRHPTSDSVFFYFKDPDGLTVEYSYGMEEFSENGAREARIFPVVPDSFDSWGGEPTADFKIAVPVETAGAT